MENSESYVNGINTSVFFKEFTFGFDLIIENESKKSVELADNIVWLDDLFIIYQVKERNQLDKKTDFENWFINKVKKKAVKQIKNTLLELGRKEDLRLTNNKGHVVHLADVPANNVRKVIIYNPNEEIEEHLRFEKFYISKEVGLIHLFHLEDYFGICDYLITPIEINDYLIFREEFYESVNSYLNGVPEQYVLGHYLSGNVPDHIDFDYIKNLQLLDEDINSFDMGDYLSEFGDKVKFSEKEGDYYHILREIAKLNRHELKVFKERFHLCFERCKEGLMDAPFRIATSKSCGFVFVPLPKAFSKDWSTVLKNVMLFHKYESKVDKCVGVIVFESENGFGIFWGFTEEKWEYNPEMEILLKDAPMRPTRRQDISGYNFKN